MTDQELKIKLLEMEIEALRSVLCEYDEHHEKKECYTQWHAAEAFSNVRNHIK